MPKLWLTFLLAGAVTATHAQVTTSSSVDANASALTAQTAVDPADAAAREILGRRNCLAETGSHIIRKDQCINAAGRGYGRTAIERTSNPGNTAETLRQLDPAIQIRP